MKQFKQCLIGLLGGVFLMIAAVCAQEAVPNSIESMAVVQQAGVLNVKLTFKEALATKKNRASAEGFRKLSPSCQREYLVWLSTAKRPETRDRRLKETLAALASGRRWAQRKLG